MILMGKSIRQIWVEIFPGSLAAWFRSKYPYMVDGAVASSAPVVAEMDFEGIRGPITNTCRCNIQRFLSCKN